MKLTILTKSKIALFLFFLCCTTATTVQAKIESGVMQFMKPKAITIHRQDVTLSLDKINSNYVYINNSALDLVETLVFPVSKEPSIKKLFEEQPFNNLDIIVDGRPVEYNTLERNLQNINGQPYTNVYYYWAQAFPPAKEVHIAQSYKPRIKLYRSDANFIAHHARHSHPWLNFLRHKKCHEDNDEVDLEDQVQDLEENLVEAFPHIEKFCPKHEDYISLLHALQHATPHTLISREINYNLINNDNWSDAIEHFTLQIEHPANMLVLSCWPHSFARSSPTTLLFSAENYAPIQDIKLLFVQTN